MTETTYDLPDGWRWTAFGEAAEHRLGKMLDKGKNEGTPRPYLRNINVRWHGFDLSDLREMRVGDDEMDKYTVRKGDLVICEGGEPGRAAIWTRDEPTVYQKALHRARPREGVEAAYLLYFLEHEAISRRLAEHFTGSTINHLTGRALAQVMVPLAPLAEQRRIVDAIEALFSDLGAGVQALKTTKRQLARYRQSVLNAAVTGDLTTDWRAANPDAEPAETLLSRALADDPPSKKRRPNPAQADMAELPTGWTWAQVYQVGSVQLGRQRAPQHHKGDDMRPYLRVANVYEQRIDTTDVKEMNFTADEFETYHLVPGDILLNEGQSPELVGRPAMYNGEIEGACFQNTLIRFKAGAAADRRFSLIYFLACLHNGRFRQLAGQTVNIAHLGAGRFAEMEFPLPPLAEQAAIVEAVEERLSVADAVARDVAAQLARAIRLRRGILQRAFEGRLVPQSASVPAGVPGRQIPLAFG